MWADGEDGEGIGGGGVMIASSMEAPTEADRRHHWPKQDSRLYTSQLNCQLTTQLVLASLSPSSDDEGQLTRKTSAQGREGNGGINARSGIPTWWVPNASPSETRGPSKIWQGASVPDSCDAGFSRWQLCYNDSGDNVARCYNRQCSTLLAPAPICPSR